MSYHVLKRVLSDRPIAFHPALSRAFGGVYEALLFQQLAYWSDKGDDPEWIYKTRDELREETTMNRYQQEQARATLRKLGVIEEERRGLPARMYYRVVWDRVFALLEAEHPGPPVGRPSTNKKAEDDQLVGETLPTQSAEGGPTSKSTSETTSQRKRFETSKGLHLVDEAYDDARVAILPYVTDLARELNDQAPLASTTTRVLNIYRASGLDIDRFIEHMLTARSVTQKRTSSIRTTSTGIGGKPKVQYWFAILEDLVSDQPATGTGDQ